MIEEIPQRQIESLLNQLFPCSSGYALTAIRTEPNHRLAWINTWMARLQRNIPQSTVLPRIIDKNKVEWLAFGFDYQEFSEFMDSLKSFIGTSYASEWGVIPHDSEDTIYQSIRALSGNLNHRFISTGGPNAGSGQVKQALTLMNQTLELRQTPDPLLFKSPQELLRDFRVAILAGDRPSAEQQLELIRQYGFLDPNNLLFLKIRMLSELGFWKETLELEGLMDVIASRKPTPVTGALIEAVYQYHLAEYEELDVPNQAIDHFKSVVLPQYQGLLTSRFDLTTPSILKIFMMLAVSAREPNIQLKDEIIEIPNIPEMDMRYLEKLASTISKDPVKQIVPSIENILQLTNENDYDGAFNMVLALPNSFDKARILLECAYELKTLRSREAFRSVWIILGKDDHLNLLATRHNQTAFAEIILDAEHDNTPVGETKIPNNWTEWFQWVAQSSAIDESLAVNIADQGSKEWDIEPWLESYADVELFKKLFKQLENSAVVHSIMPHLYISLTQDPQWPRKEFQEIYKLLFDLICNSTTGNHNDLSLITDLCGAILGLGVEPPMYRNILDYTSSLISNYNSPVNFDWAIDCLDLLSIYPTTDVSLRTNVLQRSLENFLNYKDRLTSTQRDLLATICQEFDYPINDALQEITISDDSRSTLTPGSSNSLATLNGQRITIYSLNPNVNARAKALLENLVDDVKIDISSDKVGNSRLRELARNSDIIVILTGHATHAATGFIEQNRDRPPPPIRPKGKGSSSILNEIRSYAETLT